MRNTVRLVFIVLCLSFSVSSAGLIVIGVALFSAAERLESKGDDATAVVTDISLEHHRVLVRYTTYRGKSFERTLPWFSSSYNGQEIPIHVNPENPMPISNPDNNRTADSERSTGTWLITMGALVVFTCALGSGLFSSQNIQTGKAS